MLGYRYIDQFLKYRAAGDIINVVSPIQKFSKEISEAMATIKLMRGIMLKSPMEYTLIDLCSGNALTPAISAFTLPSRNNIAVDKRPRNRQWNLIKRFSYLNVDIHDPEIFDLIDPQDRVIISAIHCCGRLAERVIDIFNNSSAEHLILMPCCQATISTINISDVVKSRIGGDILWGLHLLSLVNTTKKRLSVDKEIISPRNTIISAAKTNKGE